MGTVPFCLLEFEESPRFLWLEAGSGFRLRARSHYGWVEGVDAVVPGLGEFKMRRAFAYKNRQYWDVCLPEAVRGEQFGLRVRGDGREYYAHRFSQYRPEMSRDDLFCCPAADPGTGKRTIGPGAVGYQIFPDRFCRFAVDDEDGLEPWGAAPRNDRFCGGTIRGITYKLDYLKDLGVDFLYLNPVFHAATAHRYDTIDYYAVDPLLGTEADLGELVAEAHERGMAVVLDLALNHCGAGFFAFRDVVEFGRDSRYRHWFHIHEFPVQVGNPCSYDCWQGDASLPEYNFEEPEVREYLLDVACYWVKACDVDGYRLDTSTSLPMCFVAELAEVLRASKPGFTLVGEVWHGNVDRLMDEGGIDGVTNYPLYWDVIAPLTAGGTPLLEGLADALLNWLFFVPVECVNRSWNFLGNHDVPRLVSILKEPRYFEPLLTLMFAIPGCPVLYYGDEAGLVGGDDPANRGCMDWEAVDGSVRVRLIKTLTGIRKRFGHVFASPLLSVPIACRNDRLLGVLRTRGDDAVLFLIHLGPEETMVDLGPVTGGVGAADLLTGETLEGDAPLAPWQSRVLYFKSR